MYKTLLVATHNQGKVAEFAEMMADLGLDWRGLADLAIDMDVAETGQTFYDNAALKARTYAAETGYLTLADDSGLEVDALNGQPGVFTARYGGEGLTHKDRYMLLLHNLRDVPWAKRQARFRCAIVLADAQGELLATAVAVCEGIIALEAAGEGGFGYDPVFYLPQWGCTMAQLDSATKHQISHRGQAMKLIEPRLRKFLC